MYIFEGKYLYSSIVLNKLRFQNQNTLSLIFCLMVCLRILQKGEFFQEFEKIYCSRGKGKGKPFNTAVFRDFLP